MTTIASILAAEQAAFQNLQVGFGGYAGAVAEHWVADPNAGTQFYTGQKYNSYATCRGLYFAMQGFIQTGAAVPSWLMTMVDNYITFAFQKLSWSQEIAALSGTDSSSYAYPAGAYLLHLRDGTFFALKSSYFVSPMNATGRSSLTYGSGSSGAQTYGQAATNLQSMFIKGALYNHYCAGENVLWPGFVINQADYSFVDPLNQLIARAYEKGYVTASQSGSVVTVTTAPSYGGSTPPLQVGAKITWPTGQWASVTSFGTGTGGVGTYNVDISQTVASNSEVFVESYEEQQYVAIDADFYDGNDALCGTLLELVFCYFDQLGASSLAAWVTSTVNGSTNWEALRWLAAGALVNCDPNTGLPFATPFTQASYYQDTVETLQGIYAFCEICNTLTVYDNQTFAAFSAGGFSVPSSKDWAVQACAALRRGLVLYTQSQYPQAGLPNVGFNGQIQLPLNPTPTYQQSVLEPWAAGFLADYFYGTPANNENEAAIDATNFEYMTAQNGGNGFPTSSPWTPTAVFPTLYGPQLGVNYPNAYYYIPAAMAIGNSGAPFTLAQFETFVNNVYTALTSSTPNRAGFQWWVFESGAFMWLCQILISKGAA